jgi:hypothetical protein
VYECLRETEDARTPVARSPTDEFCYIVVSFKIVIQSMKYKPQGCEVNAPRIGRSDALRELLV